MYHIVNVAVVDPRDGSITAHQDIRIADGRIAGISATGGPKQDLPAVDGRDRFVVPGFVDMHAHPLNLGDPSAELKLMLAHGITGYRQMSGTPLLLRRRQEYASTVDGQAPKLLATPGSVLTPINAGKPDMAVAGGASSDPRGCGLHLRAALITPEVYFAVQAEADRLSIPVVGHLPAGNRRARRVQGWLPIDRTHRPGARRTGPAAPAMRNTCAPRPRAARSKRRPSGSRSRTRWQPRRSRRSW